MASVTWRTAKQAWARRASLNRLNATIDWEIFRPIRHRMDANARKSNVRSKPTCRILMLTMLIFERLNSLSDERLQ